jgi:ABC-2 type transport system ATP-binding protein
MARETGITNELDVNGQQPPQLPPPDALVITTDRLTKTYGPRDAVHELSIGVHKGEVYGLLGPNGAGKTTTLRILLGLVRPTSGSATVCDARPGSPQSLARVGALVEEPALYPYLSGRDNLRVLARYSKVAKTRIDEVLDLVGLTPRARDKVKTYSLGMRQRLGVAAALLKDPDVLILDEPTNGLDPRGMAQMRAAQVLHIVAHPIDRARAVLEASGDVDSVSVEGDTLVVVAPVDAAAALNTALVRQGIAVSRLGVSQRSLEDVFLDMTDDDTAENGDTTSAGARNRDAASGGTQ